MLDALRIAELHDAATECWHRPEASAPAVHSPFQQLVLDQHRSNFDLWHWEDAARDPLAADRTIAGVKHAIDEVNQRRNDLVERLDFLLFNAAAQNDDAALHSETPGLMIDRLSILALKIFHTGEEIRRTDAGADHRRRNGTRLETLMGQRSDLLGCLDALWNEIVAGSRRFKLYRQLKMYNDATLNPVLYGAMGKAATETSMTQRKELPPKTGH